MKIYFENIESFYIGIHELTKKGLTFRAYADGLVIELTGGF